MRKRDSPNHCRTSSGNGDSCRSIRRTFLDCDGAQFVLIGASENPEKELGIEFKPNREDEHRADILGILKLPRELIRETLFQGKWK